MPLVRVVIPTFNRAAAVCEALASVQAQTFADFDVVVVDDGSADDTVERVLEASRRDPRIRVVEQRHGGAAAARNTGIAAVGSFRYVAFLDADDLWSADHLRSCVDVLEEEPGVALVFGAFETRDLTGTWTLQDLDERRDRVRHPVELSASARPGAVHILDPVRTFSAFLQSHFFPATPTVVIRVSSLGTGGWFDTTLLVLEDSDLFLRLAATGQPWAFIDNLQATVRFLGDNLTRSNDLSSLVTLARQSSALCYARRKLPYCRTAAERDSVREEIAGKAYIVGQCCAEQHEWRAARAAYVESAKASPNLGAMRSLVGSYLPAAAVSGLKRMRGVFGTVR